MQDHAAHLKDWIHRAIGQPETQLSLSLRGNILHVLLTGRSCPEQISSVFDLVGALRATDINNLMPPDAPPIYQLCLYGKQVGKQHPRWRVPLHLNQLDRYWTQVQARVQPVPSPAAALKPKSPQRLAHESPSQPQVGRDNNAAIPDPSPTAALVLPNRSLAQRGDPEAIARYLSETLSKMGVWVQVEVKAVSYRSTTAAGVVDALAPKVADSTNQEPAAADTTADEERPERRLWIACTAAYSPDPLLIAEPTAQKLRDLSLEGFRDSILLIQVQGEPKPDWVLRVDLTPPTEMLREWARWGDLPALSRLVHQALGEQGLRATVELKDTTLHVVCEQEYCGLDSSNGETAQLGGASRISDLGAAPEQEKVSNILLPLLDTLAPQGIHGLMLHGQSPGQDMPAWSDWVDLPAAEHPTFAPSTLDLAKQGDLSALAILLNRLLNPDLERQLQTGGVRTQLLLKKQLLHVMTDAPVCPQQKRVVATVSEFLKQLQLPAVSGIRLYGRRAGQKRPRWSYGADLKSRTQDRIVPEATPEFAASTAYVGDLLSQSEALALEPDSIVLDPSQEDDFEDFKAALGILQNGLRQLGQQVTQGLRQGLLRSQMFISQASSVKELSSQSSAPTDPADARVALVWGAVGLLLMVQADWMLSRFLNAAPDTASSPNSEVALTSSTLTSSAAAADAPTPPDEADSSWELSNLSLGSSKSEASDANAFDGEEFTDPVDASPTPPIASEPFQTSLDAPQPAIAEIEATVNAIEAQIPVADLRTLQSPYDSFTSKQLDQKLALYYERLATSGPPDVLIFGSSRALRGVNPAVLKEVLSELGYTDVSVFNFGINGSTAQIVELTLRRILTPDQLPKLVLWADGARAFNSGRVDVTYNAVAVSPGYTQLAEENAAIPAPPQPEITHSDSPTVGIDGDVTVADAASYVPLRSSYTAMDNWLSDALAQLSTIYSDRDRLQSQLQGQVATLLPGQIIPVSINNPDRTTEGAVGASEIDFLAANQERLDIYGFLPLDVRFNPATYYQKHARVSGDYDNDYDAFQLEGRQDIALRVLLEFTKSQELPLIFVNMPLTDEYLDAARFRHEQAFRQYMHGLAAAESHFIFRDLGELWPQQFDYFSDPSHLNRYGAYQVSNRLAQDPLIPWPSGEGK